MLKISIDKEELQRMRDAYKQLETLSNSLSTLKREFDSFFKWAETNEATTDKPYVVQPSISSNGYSRNFTWKQKTEYVLRASSIPITTKELVVKMIELEPPLGNNRKKVVGTVSSILSSKLTNQFFIKDKNERGTAVYSIRE